MTTAVVSFGVGELVQDQASKFASERNTLARVYRWVPWRVMRAIEDAASSVALRFLDRHARFLASQAVWFRGARVEIESSPAARALDSHDRLRAMLDEMERGVANISEKAGRLANEIDAARSRPGEFTTALRRLGRVAEELRGELRDFKGAMQAHDANIDALNTARRIAATAEELDAELDRAFG